MHNQPTGPQPDAPQQRKRTARRRTRAASPRRPDPLSDLVTDHRRLRRLLTRLARAQDPGVRELLFQDIQDEFHVHARLEEDILYPAFREVAARPDERRLYFEATEAHAAIARLAEAMRHTETHSEAFSAQSSRLRDYVAQHADDEEQRMFPLARRLLSRGELTDVGRIMRRRRAALMGDPYASASSIDWPGFLPGSKRPGPGR